LGSRKSSIISLRSIQERYRKKKNSLKNHLFTHENKQL